MPLSADDVVQENSGTVTTPTTSCVVSLGAGTTAGNTLIVFLTTGVSISAVPAGFVLDKSAGTPGLRAYRKSEVAASETSWTWTTGGNTTFSWYVAELSGVDPVEPLDASAISGASGTNVANGGTLSTGTAPLNAGLNTVVLAAFAVAQAGSDTQSWSSYTNGFEEVADLGSGQAVVYQLAVARKFVTGTTDTFEDTATLATSASSPLCYAMVVAYRAADSPIVAPLAMLAGFEWGTHGGITATTGASSTMGQGLAHTGTWGTGYLIQAASARNSDYGLRVVQSGAGVAVRAGDLAAPSGSFGLDVRVVSATGTVVVAAITSSIGSVFAQLLYDTSTSQFGVRAGTTGTISWQGGTTAINTWVQVDLRVKTSSSTWRVEWRLETGADTYTEQAAAELSGQGVFNFHALQFGYNAAQTMTADFDNACLSRYWVAYPLGPHQIRLLTVDPAGTPTISGTSTNFSRFTANGTLAAINAATAALLVDEVPPTVSASADGVCQTAVAASDYIEFPMAAPVVAADEIVDGVRMLAAMWGGTGTGTGTVGLRGWDGTAETTLIAASVSYDAGSPTAVSSTEPYWQCAMWPSPNGWTEAELGALALRFGFSTDATPDMGTDALYLEYATRKAVAAPVLGEAASVSLTQNTNPYTTGVRSLVTTTPSDQGTTLNWTDAGGPHTQVVAASTTDTQTLDAGAGEVTFVELVSENLPADRP